MPDGAAVHYSKVLTDRAVHLTIFQHAQQTLPLKESGCHHALSTLCAGLREGFADNEGYLNGIFARRWYYFHSNWCTQRCAVTIADLPSEMSGKIRTTMHDWLAGAADYTARPRARAATRIVQQQLQPRAFHADHAIVAAGEFLLEIDGHHQEAISKKKVGAPIDYVFPQPFVPVKSLVPIYMSSRPPHPHAAALLADFLMSKKGQDIMHGHGRWVGHKSVLGKGPDDVGDRKLVIPSADKWGDRYQELIGLFNKLLLRKSGA